MKHKIIFTSGAVLVAAMAGAIALLPRLQSTSGTHPQASHSEVESSTPSMLEAHPGGADTDIGRADNNSTLLTGLAKELSALRKQLDALDTNQKAIQHALSRMHGTDRQHDDQQAMTTPAYAQEDQILQQQNALDDRLRNEPEDTAWADDMLTALDGALRSDALDGIELVNSLCGTTLCQLDLMISRDIPIEQGMQQLSEHRTWTGQTFFTVGADGAARIYFAREGHELPRME